MKPDTQVGGEFLPPTIQVPFYQPTAERYKILMEARPFPSDYVSPLVGDWGGGGGGGVVSPNNYTPHVSGFPL